MTVFLPANEVKIIAHRGASNIAPENTLKAFQKAKELKADFIELDVHLSNSNVPIVVHDLLLAKLYPYDSDKHNDETKKIFSFLKGEKIPTLKEVLSLFPDIGFMVEIKTGSATDQKITREVIKTIKMSKHKNVKIGSFSIDILKKIKKYAPNIALIAIIDDTNFNLLKNFLELNIEIVAAEFLLINQEFVDYMHYLDKKVWAWTVDDKKIIKKMIKNNVDGLITNNVQLAKSIIN